MLAAMDTRALSFGGVGTATSRVPRGLEVHQKALRATGLRRQQIASMPSQVAGMAQYVDSMAEATATGEMAQIYETVGEVMTTTVPSVTQDTSVTDALDLIVKHRITGMPVVDADNVVVGVVSDYDLLAPDMSSENTGMFPALDVSWQTFREIQTLTDKMDGQIVGDVMTEDPVSVRPNTSLDMATRILLESKIRRLPVVDKDGKLVGLLSRRNIVAAALQERRRNDMPLFNNAVRLA